MAYLSQECGAIFVIFLMNAIEIFAKSVMSAIDLIFAIFGVFL
ncbi:hypothetical protein HFN_0334 [Helicobacter fennelliae MRY12-0050]|uniref:Uncharacterized protein n=1 Tax=Helicobacter fennelliae MRY12-0050 TaxID=1325130 RepID=T1DW05_9HELI|nr:hypothetical protein HFN_0334 [Helicobacter fennelliae MRY12-0050]